MTADAQPDDDTDLEGRDGDDAASGGGGPADPAAEFSRLAARVINSPYFVGAGDPLALFAEQDRLSEALSDLPDGAASPDALPADARATWDRAYTQMMAGEDAERYARRMHDDDLAYHIDEGDADAADPDDQPGRPAAGEPAA